MIHEDKRRFMRMMVNTQAQLTVLSTGHKLQGTCHDLSATGLSIIVDEPLEINEMLEVFIDSHGGSIPPLNAHVKVIRCGNNSEGEGYILGLEIVQFN
ncbi:PilZ domain-containing protein [Pseudoalteromonas sp. OOF1S-7]|uniref:PilZ domain-containing protein n=1 Tax=Pseudoalteromonas sp. OOF1S-7 TaxID=2917757 RepID=UPI001EF430EE|nr:PilZ domain-containing protein [Pseudoalteromonas sp. OOF1S-7]MCG7533515.1 PilZ domain-containing protein [Pseudoalteromonas sp. OOF1S-7]